MQFSPDRCCNIIVATVVLHNMCIADNTQLPAGLAVIEVDCRDEDANPIASNESGTAKRQKLIQDVFS